MDPDRRRFLTAGLAAGLGGLLPANPSSADDVESELRARLKFLSPPDGIVVDDTFGVPFRSPKADPFQDELVIPPVAEPAINMSGDDWLWKMKGTEKVRLSDAEWLEKFNDGFQKVSAEYRKDKIEIGDPPDPKAHQRFFEFRPQKFYVIREVEVPRKYHTDYGAEPNCHTWCYEIYCKDRHGNRVRLATSPGPTIHARYSEPILVRRINNLPEVGNGRVGARVKFALPSTTTHLHNAHTASESDGNPDDFIDPGEFWDHHYGNFPSGFDEREKLTTLWYHDHRMDYTAANVYAGLDGFYLLFDETKDETGKPLPADRLHDVGCETQGWQLPSGKYDIPLMLHDLLFHRESKHAAPQLAFDGYNSNGVLGDQFTVNRVIRPCLQVERRKYRFRVVNGGPSRFYDLSLLTREDVEDPSEEPEKRPFVLVTGDGNFQPSPIVADSLFLGVAQRADFVLDFSAYDDKDQIYLVNRLLQIRGEGTTGQNVPLPEPGAAAEDIDDFFAKFSVIRFDVTGPRVAKKDDPSLIRLTYRPLPKVDLTEVVRERVWHFDHDGGLWTVNGRIFDGNRIDAGIEEGTAEIWTLRNSGNNWQHPIHSHFTEFIALEEDGQPFYQTNVQTGEAIHQGHALQRTLIDVQSVRQRSVKKLSGADPFADLPADSLDAIRRLHEQYRSPEGQQEAFDPKRKLGLTGPMLQLAADRLTATSIDDTFASVKELLKALPEIKKKYDVDLHVDRFSGGPRRDIALLLPGTELKVFMRWRDFRGKYVMHCHNVVHEDHAMMVRWDIRAYASISAVASTLRR